MNPLVSIIIPTYNRAHLISETLESIIAQTYPNWECIIVDDGSTDFTLQVVNDLIKDDNRFQLIERPDDRKKGASSCRNIGLEKARGFYVQFLDSDDILSVDKIAEQLTILEQSSFFSFVFCKWGRFKHSVNDVVLFDELEVYQNFTDPIEFLNTLTVSKGYLPIHSFLFPRKLIDKVGYWDENLGINDDGEFISRIVINFKDAIFTAKGFALYRISEDETSLSAFGSKEKVLMVITSWEIIFKLYKSKFKGAEKKYRIYIKKGVFLNTKKYVPNLINHTFFAELKFYFLKERIFDFLKKIYK